MPPHMHCQTLAEDQRASPGCHPSSPRRLRARRRGRGAWSKPSNKNHGPADLGTEFAAWLPLPVDAGSPVRRVGGHVDAIPHRGVVGQSPRTRSAHAALEAKPPYMHAWVVLAWDLACDYARTAAALLLHCTVWDRACVGLVIPVCAHAFGCTPPTGRRSRPADGLSCCRCVRGLVLNFVL
ncbi:hypothetical protein IW261DRAFT_133179 [Armillaria novae-zelandiae]|uniref:Uncharacterized protein n=1 Tax=Armillaria novae-zelandiae TaxID=153914 RepID=A0AA39NEH0_9AGAR|nr:hypothetical protein IW261DRAFT_133179 [Armillaria novae-zelandiae]